jgi:hypothetical protein
MHMRLTLLATAALIIIPASTAIKMRPPVSTEKGSRLEILHAVSVSYIQMQMIIVNKDRQTVAVPLCGDSELCDFYAVVEQAQDRQGQRWRRTIPHPVGDVSFGRIAEIKQGESLTVTFRFDPLERKFDDGTALRYPGRVRLLIRAWQKKEWVGHDSLALELLSDEFDIPAPPVTWTRGLAK